jgi:hypothetical protein
LKKTYHCTTLAEQESCPDHFSKLAKFVVIYTKFLRTPSLPSFELVAPLHFKPLQNATFFKMKSDNFKVLQKRAESDSFVTDSALCVHAALDTGN